MKFDAIIQEKVKKIFYHRILKVMSATLEVMQAEAAHEKRN